MNGKINSINGIETNSLEKLSYEISKYSPRETIVVETENSEGKISEYNILLGEHPENKSKSWIGITFSQKESKGVMGKIYSWITSFKEEHVYYKSNYEAAEFIYDLLWWIILISLSVALVNMLPMGIFDGGMFFYVTILGITKKEKTAKKWFSGVTYFLLALVLVMMIFWGISFFR
jgi:membrane-associated protease RseP (regulator of RpoE activity)